MNSKLFLLFLVICFTIESIICLNPHVLSFKELKGKVAPDVYEKDISPNLGEDKPVEVGVTLYVMDYKFNVFEKELYVDMYFRQKWVDPRLQTSRPGINITGGQALANLIWTPDTFFTGTTMVRHINEPSPNTFVHISHEGHVLFSERFQTTMKCLRDRPECTMEMESYGHGVKDIDYVLGKGVNSTNINEAIIPPGFSKINIGLSKHITALTSGNYSRLVLSIEFIENKIKNQILLNNIPTTMTTQPEN
jgi:hypothetical protein